MDIYFFCRQIKHNILGNRNAAIVILCALGSRKLQIYISVKARKQMLRRQFEKEYFLKALPKLMSTFTYRVQKITIFPKV